MITDDVFTEVTNHTLNKVDFIKAVDSVLSSKIGEPFGDLIGGEVAHLQANRKSSALFRGSHFKYIISDMYDVGKF